MRIVDDHERVRALDCGVVVIRELDAVKQGVVIHEDSLHPRGRKDKRLAHIWPHGTHADNRKSSVPRWKFGVE